MPKIINNYTLTDLIGQGQYGKVYKAFKKPSSTHRLSKNQQTNNIENLFAVKCVSLNKLTPNVLALTQNQLQSLKQLNEPKFNTQYGAICANNVIEFVEVIRSKNYLYIVYQFCQEGTLTDKLIKNKIFTQKQALKIFRQLINAFKQLHSLNIIHRDVKPQNIFFKNGILKLADFGFCKKLKFSQDLTQTSLGSPLYMAPQVLNHDVYSSKVDVWSCGIVLYEMLFGSCPFGTCNINQLLKCYKDKRQINFQNFNKILSRKTQIMLRRMLQVDQIRRISWEDLFYQYQFSLNGQIIHKEKDFQYDLMKLMKKTSIQSQIIQKTILKGVQNKKIDWQKVLELNSSVHSQQFEVQKNYSYSPSVQKTKNCADTINQVVQMKRTVKQYQARHGQFIQLTNIILNMVQSQKQYEYNSIILYFLIYNLQKLIKETVKDIKQYMGQHNNENILRKNLIQKNILDNLIIVFQEQYQKVIPKINSIKSMLFELQEWQTQIFRYPNKLILKKYVSQFVQNYENESPFSTKISSQGNLNDSIRLLRILWGVRLVDYQKNKIENICRISMSSKQTQNKSKVHICALMGKILNDLQI